MKKALIFDPYLDTLGGGERYILSFALGLVQEGYSVEIAWPDRLGLINAEKRFGLDLSTLSINEKAYYSCVHRTSLLKRFMFTRQYDLIFWVSDGSLPFLFSKNNLIHFQVPFKTIGGNALVNKIKTIFVHRFVYNSEFTRNVHENHFPKQKGFVLYPPIDTQSFLPAKKEKIILSVARFDSPSHSKRQDILIEAFRELGKSVPDYKMILVGGLMGNDEVISRLKKQASGLSVEFIINPKFTELKSLYSKAQFFWHAAGFGVDEVKDPEKVEHFGMTTVEAMASGAVPIVIAKGGQAEIITTDTGYLCNNTSDIASKTLTLIHNQDKSSIMSKASEERSCLFSIDNFNRKIKTLL